MDFDINKWSKRFKELQNILKDSEKNLTELRNINKAREPNTDTNMDTDTNTDTNTNTNNKNGFQIEWIDEEPNPFIVEIEKAPNERSIRQIVLAYHLYCCRLSNEYLKTCFWYIGDLTYEKALDIRINSKKSKQTLRNMIFVGSILDTMANYTSNCDLYN